MNRKRYKKLPIIKAFDNATIDEQYSKIWEEMEELAEASAIVFRRQANGTLTRANVAHLAEEAFDVSQAAQQLIHIICKTCGTHYCLTENEVYETAITKNRNRGYYDEQRNV